MAWYSSWRAQDRGGFCPRSTRFKVELMERCRIRAGNVYELSPSASGWTEKTLYSLDSGYEGYEILGGVAMDQRGNLYGTARFGRIQGGGTAYQLAPSDGGWTYTLMQAFSGIAGPVDTPTLDAAGNVYVTSTFTGGNGGVFKLTPSNEGSGQWPVVAAVVPLENDGIRPFSLISLCLTQHGASGNRVSCR